MKSNTINEATTLTLNHLFDTLGLYVATNALSQNIDPIVIPESFKSAVSECKVFVEKNFISDHNGLFINILNKLNSK